MADETNESERTGPRSQMFIHQAQVEWMNRTKLPEGQTLEDLSPAEVIAYAYATRVEWRSTDTYQEVRKEAKEVADRQKKERAEAREAAKAEAKAKRDAEAAEKKKAKEAAEAEKAAKGEGKTAAKKASKKSASTEDTSNEGDGEGGEGDEDPFAD